jgi:hypothetical protein
LRFETFKLSGKDPGGFAIITDLGGNGETRWDIQSMELRQFQNQFVAELKGPFFGGPAGFVKNCIGNELKNSRLTLNVDSTCKAPQTIRKVRNPRTYELAFGLGVLPNSLGFFLVKGNVALVMVLLANSLIVQAV